MLEVNAGTEFFLEQNLITAVLSNTNSNTHVPESVVAKMKTGDVVHEFSVMELRMLMRKLTSDQLSHLASSESSDRIELALRMFMQRYPYENSPY
ncbi:hypothetical protein PSH87_21375 [Pseudomonas sp. FP453]|uniref:hypothetical protein n=1 Tax=Pseudomonas sp. FP453 TaxID=2954094 RepID=UPI0027350EEA|nr:hypothetical protein [Pseudomonas sp. FP453]WLH89138.1 hypothetical protein PSH87_21375 [Pseudomonas sp. FP453]